MGECARDNNKENCYYNVTNQKIENEVASVVEGKQHYGQIKKSLLVNKFGHAISVSFGNNQFYISPASDDDITLTSISLVSQLLAKQQNKTEQPTSARFFGFN